LHDLTLASCGHAALLVELDGITLSIPGSTALMRAFALKRPG
jgi:hypothetical protein